MMDEILLLDLVERYLEGNLDESQRVQFDAMRRQNPDIDNLVVEHQMFLNDLAQYGERRQFKHSLSETHNKLVEQNEIIEEAEVKSIAPIRQFWLRNKRTIAVAASIAGVTALAISGLMQGIAPKGSQSYLQQLNRKMNQLEGVQREQNKKIDQLIDSTDISKIPDKVQVSAGTSFLIDEDGYLATNAHVVAGSSTLIVVNNNKEYIARKVYEDAENDLAILKIEDKDWKSVGKLPYNVRKGSVDLGEEIYTLGYPRNEIVYNRGYLSAKSGYRDDSMSIQIAISANPGNSGGPVLDKNGSIIGILSTRDRQSNDVVFASKASNITLAVEALRKDTSFQDLNLPKYSSLKGMDVVKQVKKLQNYVFMVKGY